MQTFEAREMVTLNAARSLRLTAGTDPARVVELGMVVVGGELYVRAFRGRDSAWFRAAPTSSAAGSPPAP
ncbi:hypothetical protein Ato02nite_098280 [Paractinoplanes toevensis]|uniref:DUF2255 family protein n=1 Tax=Paractinoplanes toevensis TaxID=571911 RepID=A0A919WDD8_9ACTN|nr:DUF2255 family protein [Actinoplanes toevensis]GIM98035.1 hypothetical protein Ato02nite_098280 [Actinoplanes toevensis]